MAWLAWIVLALAAVPPALLLLVIVYNAWALLVVYRGVAERRPRDVSAQERAPVGKAAAWVHELLGLGFERLGEIEVTLPTVGVIAPLRARRTVHTAWVMVDPARSTTAAMVEALVEFSSRLGDGSFVETMHPLGHNGVQQRLEVTHVPTNVSDAYQRHLEVVSRRSVEHGRPDDIVTLADYVALDAAYRQEHALRTLRPPLMRQLARLSVMAALALILLGLALAPLVITLNR